MSLGRRTVGEMTIPRNRLIALAGLACVLTLLVALVVVPSGSAGAAALAQGLNCTKTDKANGGFTLDCDPVGVTPSPTASASASSSPSASASPSVSPSPSPTATGGNNCQADPGRCGFPNDASTGATAAAGTTVLNGNRAYTVAGQVVSNTTINGCVEVRAANVSFRNVAFNVGGCFWGVRNFSTGLQVIDSSITCAGTNGTAFGSSDLSLLRVDISRCENGLNVAGRVSVTDSWIHDMNGGNGGAHTDGAQFNQGASDILFQHNTINVGPQNGATSAIIAWNEGDPQNRNVTIAGNLLAGGTYTLYCPRQNSANFRVVNNRFGTFEFGSTDSCVSGHVAEFSGNVRDSTGLPL